MARVRVAGATTATADVCSYAADGTEFGSIISKPAVYSAKQLRA